MEDLTEFTEERGGVYTPSVGGEFASNTVSPRTGRFSAQRRFNHSRLVAVFNSYVQTGEVDLSVRRRGGGGPQPSTNEFTAIIAAWEAQMDERGLALATRDAYGRVARGYLVFLEDRGVIALDGADAASVLEFLESLLATWAKSSLYWVVSNFRPFLKFINRDDLVNALSLAGVKRSHAILAVLSDSDTERVVRACASGTVSARDAAVTLLALTTGLRACDIIALRLARSDHHHRAAKDGQPVECATRGAGESQTRRLRSRREARLK
jgi:integrase